jgi:S-adenosyl-L-methionine hydrolase (adenosine-forming)
MQVTSSHNNRGKVSADGVQTLPGLEPNMIVLFTDFGLQGPYTGQMKAVLYKLAPGIPVIDLFANAPVGNPKASAYLLAAYAEWFAPSSADSTFCSGTRLTTISSAAGSRRSPIGNSGSRAVRATPRRTIRWEDQSSSPRRRVAAERT